MTTSNSRIGLLGLIAAVLSTSACASEVGAPAEDGPGTEAEIDSTAQAVLKVNGTYNGVYRIDDADSCLGGTDAGKACTPGPTACPGGTCVLGAQRCAGGSNASNKCKGHADCPGGACYGQGTKLWNAATSTGTAWTVRIANGSDVKLVAAAPTSGRYRVEYGTETGAARWGWVDGAALTLHHKPNSGLSATRTDALMRGRSAMGFSYWWGHGVWRKEGPTISCDSAGAHCESNAGRCIPDVGAPDACPRCSHRMTGRVEYGSDCAGFISTIWGLGPPTGENDPQTESVRIRTDAFFNANPNWTLVSQCPAHYCDSGTNMGKACTTNANCPMVSGAAVTPTCKTLSCPAGHICNCFADVLPADAVVRYDSLGKHIYMTATKRNPSSNFTSYECRACDMGCLGSTRAAPDGTETWRAVRKNGW